MRKHLMALALLCVVLASCKKEEVESETGGTPSIQFSTQNFSVDENVAGQTTVGELIAQYQNGNVANLQFAFDDLSDENPFTIDASSGQITVKDNAALNHEDNATYSLHVTVQDKTNATVKSTNIVTVELNDVDERPQTNLMSYFSFDGNMNDGSEYNNHGVTADSSLLALSTDRFGRNDSAYDFSDGGSIQVENYEHFNDMSEFTIALWVNLKELPASGIHTFIHKFSPGRDFAVGVNHRAQLDFHYYNAGYIFCDSPNETFPTEEWVHVIVSFSNGKMTSYLNGVVVAERETSKDFVWASENVSIGNGMKVQLDEIRVYDKVFTQDEINSWYEEESVDD